MDNMELVNSSSTITITPVHSIYTDMFYGGVDNITVTDSGIVTGMSFDDSVTVLNQTSRPQYNSMYPELDPSVLAVPWSAQITLITIYTLTIIMSVVGNTLVIVVLLCADRTRTEITVFLVNLAAADLSMACFCMPFTFTLAMLGRWIFGQVMCPIIRFMQVTSVAVSIFTNLAIGIDRLVVFILQFRIHGY